MQLLPLMVSHEPIGICTCTCRWLCMGPLVFQHMLSITLFGPIEISSCYCQWFHIGPLAYAPVVCDELCSPLSHNCGTPHVTRQTAKIVTWPWELICSTMWPSNSKTIMWLVTRNIKCVTSYRLWPRLVFKRGLRHWCPIAPFTAELHYLPRGYTWTMRD